MFVVFYYLLILYLFVPLLYLKQIESKICTSIHFLSLQI